MFRLFTRKTVPLILLVFLGAGGTMSIMYGTASFLDKIPSARQ